MSVFALDAHYYDGGLRIATFPQRSSPASTPDVEAVIFADTSTLKAQDVVFEVAIILSASRARYLWIGCYLSSADRQFGDRANYVCIGLWLSELVAIRCKPLLMSLFQAATQIRKTGMTSSLQENLHELSSIIAERYLCSRTEFPSSCQGIVKQDVVQNVAREFHLSSSVDESVAALESALINLQLAPIPFVDGSRVRFRLNPNEKVSSSTDVLPSAAELLLPLVVDLPQIIGNSVKEVGELKKSLNDIASENAKLVRQLEGLSSKLDRASAERDASKKALLEQTEELESLRKLPYTIINKQLKDVDSKLDHLAAITRTPAAYAPPPRYSQQTARKRADDDGIGLAWKIFMYSLIGLTVVIAVGFGVYKALDWIR